MTTSVATAPHRPDGVEPAVPAFGDVLGDGYLCVELLSRGEAFDVHDAWSAERHCRCIVKMLRPDVTSPAMRRRLLREGQLLATLRHPHLAHGYQVLRDPPLVASRTVGGVMLDAALSGGARLDAGQLAVIGGQLAAALRYLHEHGYLHLDVKPSNVAVEAGSAVLLDYSLAQRPGRVAAGTGTVGYLSPEQARGGRVGPAADVWGLGTLLFTAAAGRHPHDDDPSGAPGVAPDPRAWREAPTLRRFRRNVPRSLSDVIDACLHLDHTGRPPLDVVLAVCDALGGTGRPRPAACG